MNDNTIIGNKEMIIKSMFDFLSIYVCRFSGLIGLSRYFS